MDPSKIDMWLIHCNLATLNQFGMFDVESKVNQHIKEHILRVTILLNAY